MSYVYSNHPYLHLHLFTHLSQEVLDRAATNTPITRSQWQDMRLNSYERLFLTPLLSDDCLLEVCKHAIQNASSFKPPIPTTYDESIIHTLLPELMVRLQRKNNE